MSPIQEMLKAFINTYKKNRVLWDCNTLGYQQRQQRNSSYIELVNILQRVKPNAKVKDVKRKINTLRCAYRREQRKIKRSMQDNKNGALYQPRIWYYKMLSFLDSAALNVKENVDEISPFEEVPVFITSTRSQKAKRGIKSKAAMAPMPAETTTSLQLVPNASSLPDSKFDSDDNDEEYLWLTKTWAFKLRKLGGKQRLFAEKAINDILFDAELDSLERNSTGKNSGQTAPHCVHYDNNDDNYGDNDDDDYDDNLSLLKPV